MDKDPSVFHRSLKAQIDALIVRPLQRAYDNELSNVISHSQPWLIAIDGLDECAGVDAQKAILQEFCAFLCRSNTPFRLIIASRAELHIKAAFNLDELHRISWHLVLDDSVNPDADIEEFLRCKFTDIKHTHPLKAFIPDTWPASSVIQSLVGKSSGQFIYASTVVRYVGSMKRCPVRCLDIIRGIKSPGDDLPFAELDALYRYIVQAADNVEHALQILRFLVVPLDERATRVRLGKTPCNLASLLSVPLAQAYLALGEFYSILDIPPPEESEKEIRVFHASLGDFLTDRSRAGPQLFAVVGEIHADISKCWLQHNAPEFFIEEGWPFSRHLDEASVTAELSDELYKFDLIGWIKVQMSTSDAGFAREVLARILTSIEVSLCVLSEATVCRLTISLPGRGTRGQYQGPKCVYISTTLPRLIAT